MRFPIDDIASTINSRARRQPVLVAIDGGGGAGKSTLAAALAGRMNAEVVTGDDFYHVMTETERLALTPEAGYHHYFDWQRLRDKVLVPLRHQRPAIYRPYDWQRNALSQKVTRVSGQDAVIVEGVYTFRPELRAFYDFAIYVDTPRDIRLRRVRGRSENIEAWIQRWAAAEDWYIIHVLDKNRFDMIINGGRDPLRLDVH